MEMTLEEVRRLAHLARLDLSTEDAERMRGELDSILASVERLAKVDTDGVPEQEASDPFVAVRPDVARTADDVTRELILSNFPERTGDALNVPAVFENPKG
jgi:aspartyl-tRNA(Asn)/glutamyl-tRNA(Gln) amidotransferase subunit C